MRWKVAPLGTVGTQEDRVRREGREGEEKRGMVKVGREERGEVAPSLPLLPFSSS